MSTVIVHTPQADVSAFLMTGGVFDDVSVQSPSDVQSKVLGTRHDGRRSVLCECELTEVGSRTLLQLVVRPERNARREIYLVAIIFALFLVAAEIVLENFIHNLRSQAILGVPSDDSFFIMSFGLLVVLGVAAVFVAVGLSMQQSIRRLNRVADELMHLLSQEFRFEVVRKEEQVPVPRWAIFLYFHGAMFAIVFLLYRIGIFVVFVLFAVRALRQFGTGLVREVLDSDTYANWKLTLADLVTAWSHLANPVLLLFCGLYFVNVASFAMLFHEEPTAKLHAFAAGMTSFSIPQVWPNNLDRDTFSLWMAVAQLISGVFLLGATGYAVVFAIQTARKRQSWRLGTVEMSFPGLPCMRPTRRSSVYMTTIAVFFNFVFVSVESLVGIYFSVEIALRVLGMNALISTSGRLLDYVLLSSSTKQLVDMNVSRLDGVMTVLLVVLMLPLTMAVALRLYAGARRVIRGWRQRNCETAVRLVDELYREAALTGRRPLVVTEQGDRMLIYTWWPPFGRARIVVSSGLLANLDSRELKAAIAHEISHVKHDVWKIRALRLLSNATVFCPNYLTLCLDFPELEAGADRFAATLVGRELLKAAITSVALPVEKGEQEAKPTESREAGFLNRITRDIKMTYRFFFEPELIGHTYPAYWDRIRLLSQGSHSTVETK